MPHGRPDPDELLKSVSSLAASRGRLKVFLGASAGVGKTFAMLSEAHERVDRGTDVVIGFVETHGRAETEALVAGLEVIPPTIHSYRNSQFLEPDVDAIVARHPAVVIIDELAHTNAQGSKHRKRWQDVEELLDAGVDVVTAMNIQHLESLNDVIAQVTGVRVSETVPDSFLETAQEIEVIDVPPADLQQRIREGKVYIPENVDQALEGFFKTSNLTALRELALRRAADTVDAEVQKLRTQEGASGPWATKERIVVCVAPNRMASRVVRAAARLGAASHAEMIAVHVESDRQAGRSSTDLDAAQEALALAKSLGMEVVTLAGHDIVAEVFELAYRRNANLVIVGKPIKPRWKELLFGSVVDAMVRTCGDVDVHVITANDSETPARNPVRHKPEVPNASGVAKALLAAILSSLVAWPLYEGFGTANVAMLYVLGVAIFSTRSSRVESGIAAVSSVLLFNFLFVEPRLTFSISDSRYLLLFGVTLVVALVISTLTHRLRDQLALSSARERRTASLYRLSSQLAQQKSKRELADTAAREIASVFDGEVVIWIRESGKLSTLAASLSGFEETPVALWVADHAVAAGRGTDTLPGSTGLYLPLKGAESTVGVLGFKPRSTDAGIATNQFLETFANSLGLALERAILAKESNDARVQAEAERIRSTLLSSISHDLRTPLTSITGAASSLMQGSANPAQLAETIYDQSLRLDQQIQNLLDMTRLQSGIEPNLEWHAPQDLVASAIATATPSLGQRALSVDIPMGLPLIWVDGLLIEKALINLIENAGRHTDSTDSVSISVRTSEGKIIFRVADTGPGLPEGSVERLFLPGYRTRAGGYGLGLAVIRLVVKLHRGSIAARNLPERGAEFLLSMPFPTRQPEAAVE